jgi:hypothetical protein
VIFSADWQGGGPDSVGIQLQGAKPQSDSTTD